MTVKRCPENVKITRRYVQFLKEAKGRDPASIDTVEKAIERYDEYHRRKDWRRFNIEQPLAFKTHLSEQTNARTGQPLSEATIVATLGALKAFSLAGGPTRIPDQNPLLGCRVFQPARQSGPYGDGPPPSARRNPCANPAGARGNAR